MGVLVSTSWGILGESGGIIRYQPTRASAARWWRLFRLTIPASYTHLRRKSHRALGTSPLTPLPSGEGNRTAYAFIDSRNSSLVLVLSILSMRNSIASTALS